MLTLCCGNVNIYNYAVYVSVKFWPIILVNLDINFNNSKCLAYFNIINIY